MFLLHLPVLLLSTNWFQCLKSVIAPSVSTWPLIVQVYFKRRETNGTCQSMHQFFCHQTLLPLILPNFLTFQLLFAKVHIKANPHIPLLIFSYNHLSPASSCLIVSRNSISIAKTVKDTLNHLRLSLYPWEDPRKPNFYRGHVKKEKQLGNIFTSSRRL